jgi:hypothetical protein
VCLRRRCPAPPALCRVSSDVRARGAAAEVLVDDALGMLPRLSRGLDVNVCARAALLRGFLC